MKTLTKRQKRAAKRACKAVRWFDDAMSSLCDDPMTAAMGVPVDDFYRDWSARHRSQLHECLKDESNTARVRQLLLDEFDRFMP